MTPSPTSPISPSPAASRVSRAWWRRDDGSDTGSFRRQIVVSTFVLGALVAIALVAVVQIVLARSTGNALDRVVGDRADAVVSSADSATTSAARLTVPDSYLDPGVAIYDTSGRLVAGTVPPSQASDFSDLSTTTGSDSRTIDDSYQLYARFFETSAGATGVVVVAEPLRPYENDERTALLVSVAAGGVIVLVATALAAWASRRALAPVAAMAATAETWSEHDLQRRFDLGEPTNEIRALGQTLDGLLARVAGAILAEQRLTSELAHELRTPLTTIKATADLLATRPDLDDELLQDVAAIQESSRVMASTITSLLDLARARAGDPRPDSPTTASADLDDVLADVIRHLEDPGRVSTPHHPDQPGLRVRVPHDLAVRAVAPVVQNAVQHASTVRITVGRAGGMAEILVEDDGPGIAAADAARVFEPGITTGTGTGAGLGLPLARRVARSLGGDVRLATDHDAGDRGARFLITLPAARPEADVSPPDHAAQRAPPTRHSKPLQREASHNLAVTTLLLLGLMAAAPLALIVLTAVGAHKRGMQWPLASLVGAVFPVTWAVWYVRDDSHQTRHLG